MTCCWKCIRIGSGVRACGLLLVVCLLAGCGGSDAPQLGSVSGTVTLDGQPLPHADVVFNPEDGAISVGKTDESGHYELRYSFEEAGAVPGRHTVRITTGDLSGDELVPEKVPVRYNYQSELAEEVNADENTINFDLKSDGIVVQPHETDKIEKLNYQAGN